MSEHDRPAAHARVRRHLLAVLALCAASIVLTPADAAAQACGGANEPACTAVECAVHGLFGNCLINRTIYSCDSNRLNVTLTLQGRVCRPCGAAGEPACSGGFCVAGTRNIAGFCASCGASGQPACSGGVCNAGTRNLLGICTACGGAEEIVCSGGTCDAGHQAVSGICKPCGSPGEVACNGSCEPGARNVLGTCRACGDAGEIVCDVGEACRDTEGRTNVRGVELGDLALCVACGGLFQAACDEAPACHPQLTPVLNRCVLADCGGEGQRQCTEGPACEPRHEPIFDLGLGIALCRSCGGPGEQQCSDAPACDPRNEPIIDLGLGIALCRPCGGHGQQQCSEEQGPACDARHEPLLNPFGGFGAGFCFECGGEGQQACRNLPACDRPLHNILGFCQDRDDWVAEPDCNCSVVPQAVAEGTPIWGFADLHAHQFANLGFGGTQFSGAPHDPDGITFALPACGFTEDFPTVGPLGVPTASVPLTGVPIHGPAHTLDPLGLAAGNSVGLSNFGVSSPPVLGLPDPARSFEGWPKWSSPNHQRMYYKWLERAWKGGLRLMIVQAVNNEVSCRTGATRWDPVPGENASDPVTASFWGCNDMDAVDRQIQAARDLEEAIDAEHDGDGWYRIVTSAAQARQVMSQGKLAVVLGIEVDSLFNCQRGFCTEADVDAELQKYYDLGVRHAYPIHLFNNDFGGTTHYFDAFNVANFVLTGSFIQSYDCAAEGYAFKGGVPVNINQDLLVTLLLAQFGVPAPPLTVNVADCNQLGLTPLGRHLVRRMIDKRMFIDLDHLSFRGVNDALEIAESEQYPVLATHVGLLDLKEGANRSERYWTAEQLQRVRDLGGLVAPILIPAESAAHTENGQVVVPNDCKASSKEWAQSYLAAVRAMSGSSYLVGVGYGSDFNGMTQALAPRFDPDAADGVEACEGDPEAGPQASPVTYPFNAHGTTGTFDRQVTGGRTFDYNNDGVAHVGLIPDFVEDLKRIGLTDQQLEPFFRSAEAFLQMWERIDARGTAPPRTTASVSPAANAVGWHNTPVTVALNAVSQAGGGAVASIAYSTAGAVTQPLVDAPGNTVSLTLAADGETTLFFRARAAGGAVEPQQSRVFRIDRTAPTVTALVAPEPNPAGWHRGNVTVTLQGSDMGSGVAGCDGPFVLTGEGAELAVSGTCSDNAGNVSATNEVSGIRIDRTPPELILPGPLTAVSPGAGGVAVAYMATATDMLSGAPTPSCTRASGSVFPVGTTPVDCTATDAAGNTTAGSFTVTVTAGAPKLSTLIAAKGRDAAGFWMDVRVTNTGTGHASAVFFGPLSFRTLSGTGTVTYDAARSGALPLSVGEVNVGESRTVRLYLNVPTSVLRFSMTASGTLQNAVGASSSFSFAQSVIP